MSRSCCGKIVGLRTIAQVIDGNAAAKIDVFERVTRLVMNRDEVFPHAFERFRKRLDVGRLRADVNVYAADVDEIRSLQAAAKSGENLRRGDAKLRREQRGL